MLPWLVDSFVVVPFIPISLLLITTAAVMTALVRVIGAIATQRPHLRCLPSLMSKKVSTQLIVAPPLTFDFWLQFLCGLLNCSRQTRLIQIPLSRPIHSRTHFSMESVRVTNCRASVILIVSRNGALLQRLTHLWFISFFCHQNQADLYLLDLPNASESAAGKSQLLRKFRRTSQLISDSIAYIRLLNQKPIYAVALGSYPSEHLLFYLCDRGASCKLKAAALLYPQSEVSKTEVAKSATADQQPLFSQKSSKTVRFEDDPGDNNNWNQLKPIWNFLLNYADDIAIPVMLVTDDSATDNITMTHLLGNLINFIVYRHQWGCLAAPYLSRDIFLFFNEVKYLRVTVAAEK